MAKVRIGTRYQRPWFRTWTPTASSSFLGPMDDDELHVQKTLLDYRNLARLKAEARYARRALLAWLAALFVALYFGVKV